MTFRSDAVSCSESEVMQLIKARYAEKTVLHGPLMKSILYASTSANPRDDSGTKGVLSATLIHEIFKVWINRPQKVTKVLCITLDTLMYAMCRSFAAHIVMNGLHAVSYTHLDVYKRQVYMLTRLTWIRWAVFYQNTWSQLTFWSRYQ